MLRRMDTKRTTLVCAAVLFGAILPATRADACSATETQVYQSATTVWCVDNGIIQQHGTFPKAFFAYGDNVVKELVSIFNVPAQGVYTFEAGPETGGAHTGSECCGLGVTVTGDAFYGDAYGATSFTNLFTTSNPNSLWAFWRPLKRSLMRTLWSSIA